VRALLRCPLARAIADGEGRAERILPIPARVGDAEGQPVARQVGGDAAARDAGLTREGAGGRGADDDRGRGALGRRGVQRVEVVADGGEDQDEVARARPRAAQGRVDGVVAGRARVGGGAVAGAAGGGRLGRLQVQQDAGGLFQHVVGPAHP
jgi:hypothetical protein